MNEVIRVLYAEDNPADAELTRFRFSELAHEFMIEVVATGEACLERMREESVDLLLLDHRLPDMDGLEILKTLIQDGINTPVVWVTGIGDETLVVQALRLGAMNYVPKSGNYLETLPDLLRDAVEEHRRKCIEGRASAPFHKVLYVEHDPMDIDLTMKHFAESAPHLIVRVVSGAEEALTALSQQHSYDLVLVDLRLPRQNGLEFMREAKSRRLLMPPLIMITGKGDDATAIATLKLGAADYIVKRDGYLNQLSHTIDHVIAHDKLRQVTERLRTEISERKTTEMALRETEAQLHSMADNSPFAMTLKDFEGRYVFVNRRFLEWFGIRSEDVIGFTANDLFSEEQVSRTRSQEELLIASGIPQERFGTFEFCDGSVHSLSLVVFLVEGSTPSIGTITADVTEQQNAEERLRHSQKMEAIGQLTGGIAHDFNNLLTIIMGSAELLTESLSTSPELESLSTIIAAAAKSGADLTRSLLTFASKQYLRPEATNINELLIRLGGMLKRTLGDPIEVDLVHGSDVGWALVDTTHLETAMLNLTVNARDAMPQGGALTIETSSIQLDEGFEGWKDLAKPGPYIRITVTDTGSGIAPDILEKAFDPFFTTKRVGQGTGLGLSMVYGFIEQSGGCITLESELGVGTIVNLYLPRVEDPLQEDEGQRKPARETQKGKETILVVEDDASVRDIVSRQLKVLGYGVHAARDAREALTLLERYKSIDLLFTDVSMPGGMNGLRLASEAKERQPTLKVLLTSGDIASVTSEIERLNEDLLTLAKPYNLRELASTLREALDPKFH